MVADAAPPQVHVVEAADAGRRLDEFLAAPERAAGLTRSQWKRRIELGEVRVDGSPSRPGLKLRAGQRVTVALAPAAPIALEPEAIPLVVLHEDPYLLVLDKPPGLVVHPAAGHATGTLVHALLHHVRDLQGIGGELRPGIVHRLDKDTSGVMVIAKDEATLAALQAIWKARALERAYLALVQGVPAPDAGAYRTLYGRDPRDRKRFSSRVPAGKAAVTHYRVLEVLAGGAAALVEARLETGRTHQVRVHLADHGHPILGDPVYGRAPRDAALREVGRALGRQALHARLLAFRHPATGEPLRFETPPPPDMAAALARLRGGAPHRADRGGSP